MCWNLVYWLWALCPVDLMHRCIMEWAEDFETGLSDIDAQHRDIFTLIQRMHAGGESVDRSSIREAIVELQQVTRSHFEYEDRLMVTCDYPDAAKHADEHAHLLLEVQGYQDNSVFTTHQLTRVLFNWLTSHIMMQDRELVRYVLQRRAGGANPV